MFVVVNEIFRIFRPTRPKSFGNTVLLPRGVVDTSVLVAGIAGFKNPEPKEPVSSALMLRDWIYNDTFLWLVNEEILDK
jgi:hypothetical protein